MAPIVFMDCSIITIIRKIVPYLSARIGDHKGKIQTANQSCHQQTFVAQYYVTHSRTAQKLIRTLVEIKSAY